MALDLRNRDSDSVVALFSIADDRVVFVVAVSPGAIRSGAKAGALVKLGSTVLGGGGGGKDDFAQGGGSDISKIAQAILELKAALGTK